MKQELTENIRTFFSSAELVFNTKDYTSAATLYFKTLFVALDLLIFRKLQKVPKDHTERFRILEKEFADKYTLLDKYFPIYRSTYTTTIDKETGEEERTHVIHILEEVLGDRV